jgi:acyl carrier protein phosphodiesterase
MNYLAHLLLADDSDTGRVASLLADFTNVPNDGLAAAYGETLAEGVVQHRRLDAFTDSHAAVVEAVRLLFPRHRHASRIIVDILFDHYLSLHWDRYCVVGRTAFIDTCHATLAGVDQDDERLPERFRRFTRRLVEAGALAAYATLEGVGAVLERVSSRTPRGGTIREALPDIRAHYDPLDRCFGQFFPEVCDQVRRRAGTGLLRPA